jgi:hypothetical protein
MRRADLTRLARNTWRTLRLPPKDVVTTLHAAVVIVVVELLIRWVPLSRLSRLLGVHLDLRPGLTAVDVLAWDDLPPPAPRQLRCSWRVAHAWPFSKGPCLRRALVAGHLVRRLGPTVHLGVTGAGGTLLAHAWLELDGQPLEPVHAFTRFEVLPTAAMR